ncbi:hypothetical protein GCM10011409_43200 [Lentibacillus populi]|uniref:Lipoprotein n=1 Tax=Lentibacillus populi TaxID=1827502 RepID=A0A9W5X7G3_9BACI|nr:hypothetical protein [Lentibacillus populi]GGB61316.1 hypothetical protein GCM10011409_43200 [Lentibacillus populi]
MKKLLVLLVFLSLVLSACGDNSDDVDASGDDAEEVTEKQSEMTEKATLNYLEQITYRYLKGSDLENGSFEQKSELNAAMARCDAIVEEIEEKYSVEDPLPSKIINLSKKVKDASQEILDGNYETNYDNAVLIGEELGEISKTYLDGELPPTAKFMIN